jgi:hypothetical protein
MPVKKRKIPKTCSEHAGLVKRLILLKNIAINLTHCVWLSNEIHDR